MLSPLIYLKVWKKIVSIGILVDSPTQRVGDWFFDYEYLPASSKPKLEQLKRNVMDLCWTGLCKNPKKSASLPCPFKAHPFQKPSPSLPHRDKVNSLCPANLSPSPIGTKWIHFIPVGEGGSPPPTPVEPFVQNNLEINSHKLRLRYINVVLLPWLTSSQGQERIFSSEGWCIGEIDWVLSFWPNFSKVKKTLAHPTE